MATFNNKFLAYSHSRDIISIVCNMVLLVTSFQSKSAWCTVELLTNAYLQSKHYLLGMSLHIAGSWMGTGPFWRLRLSANFFLRRDVIVAMFRRHYGLASRRFGADDFTTK